MRIISETWKYHAEHWVRDVAIAENGDYILAGSSDQKVYMLDNFGGLLWKYDVKGPAVRVAISAHGETCAAGSPNRFIHCLDKKGNLLWKHKTGGPVWGLAVSLNGEYIAVGSDDGNIYFFNRKGNLLWKYKTMGEVRGIAVSFNGRFVCAGSHDNNVYFLNRNGKLLWKHTCYGWVESLAISDLGAFVCIGSEDNNVVVTDNKGKKTWSYKASSTVNDVELSGNGEIVAIAEGGKVRLKRANRLYSWFSDAPIRDLAMSKNGHFIGLGSHDCNIYCLDMNCKDLWRFGTKGIVRCISVSKTGRFVVAGSDDCNIYFFDNYMYFREFVRRAEQAIESAREYGTDVTKAEEELEKAKTLLKDEYFLDAREIALNSEALVKKSKARSTLKLSMELTALTTFNAGMWTDAIVVIKNTGKANAYNITLDVSSGTGRRDVRIKGIRRHESLAVGDAVELNIGIRPSIFGPLPLRVTLKCTDFDGKEHVFEGNTKIDVLELWDEQKAEKKKIFSL